MVRAGGFYARTQSHGLNLPATEAGNCKEAHGIYGEHCCVVPQCATSSTIVADAEENSIISFQGKDLIPLVIQPGRT